MADFLLLGGDARQTALAKLLTQRFSVQTLGVPELPDIDAPHAAHLVLPIPSAAPDGSPRGVDEKTLDRLIFPGCTVFGGAMRGLAPALEAKGARCVDLLQDEETVRENARLTADAAPLLLMQHTGQSLFGQRCCVIGYGRIGQLLCARLAAFGSEVCVLSVTPEKRALAEGRGFAAEAPAQIGDFTPQLVCNTAPTQLVPTGALRSLPSDTLWVELASAPGGLPQTPLPFSRLPAGGLPGRLLPVSAGAALYRAILKTM